jgi:hypothetical protein
MDDLLDAHSHTTRNRGELESSRVCGCIHCLQIFDPEEIVAWTGVDMNNLDDPAAISAETAVCPHCGSESVIGDRSGYLIQPQFLGRMHQAWFQKTILRKPAAKK